MKNSLKSRYLLNRLRLDSILFYQWPGGRLLVKDYLVQSRKLRRLWVFAVAMMLLISVALLLLGLFAIHQYTTKASYHTTDYLIGIILVVVIPVYSTPFYFSSLKWMLRNYKSNRNNFN